ncbi:retrovirus-related pol polyprotein from transposon TNT 1-94 [Tanacetum coccineum]
MITTNNSIKDKKPSRLMLLPMGILETFPCVKDVDYITRDLAVSSVRKNIMQISAQKQIIGPQESILRDELAFVHFRIPTLEKKLSRIFKFHQNLLQSENPNHQATILANSFKDFERSNVPGIKLSSFSESDDTFTSLQALLNLHYLFSGFMDYFWSPTRKIEESLNVTFDETPPPSKTSPLVDDDLDEDEAIREIEKKNLENNVEDETLEIDEVVNIKESRNHPLENVIGNLNQRTLRSQAQNQSNFYCFISTIEPKNVNEALGDESWIVAMQEELNQFIANDVWELVPQPKNMTVIGTKWVFRNKLDENGIVSRNKARLVAQGYNQQEGIDYDLSRLEYY